MTKNNPQRQQNMYVIARKDALWITVQCLFCLYLAICYVTSYIVNKLSLNFAQALNEIQYAKHNLTSLGITVCDFCT